MKASLFYPPSPIFKASCADIDQVFMRLLDRIDTSKDVDDFIDALADVQEALVLAAIRVAAYHSYINRADLHNTVDRAISYETGKKP